MIYYFSATGNTKWAATKLANLLHESLQPIESIVGKASRSPIIKPQDDVLGFCFPVHGWRLPKLVKEFLESFAKTSAPSVTADGKKPYTFVLLTCGDDCAQTIRYFKQVAEPNGIHLDAAFSLKMPESYVGLSFMDVDKKQREQQKISIANQELPHIAQLINSRTPNIYNVHEGACPWLKSTLLGGFFHSVLVTDKRFKLDEEKCIACGKCVKVCPVENIKLNSNNKPEWLHTGKCMTCLACYHFCPTHAIVFNNQTQKKGQYCKTMDDV